MSSGKGSGDGAAGSGRLSSLRAAPDLSMSGGASRKPRFKPNIPTKPVIKQEGGQEAAGGSAATSEGGGVNQGGGRAPRDKSEGKDERGRSKAGRGRGQQRPSGPVIVTFRGTGGAKAGSSQTPAHSLAYSSGSASNRGSRGAKAAAAAAAGEGGGDGGAGPMQMGDDDDTLPQLSLLPTTLPLTPVPPWDLSMVEHIHKEPPTVVQVRKAVRSINKGIAVQILGEERYAAIIRSERWDPEALGLTPELIAKIESRRLLENPHALQLASVDYLKRLNAVDEPPPIPLPGDKPVVKDPEQEAAEHYFNAAKILTPEAEEDAEQAPDKLLLFQMPHSLPFVEGANAPEPLPQEPNQDEWDGAVPKTTSPLTGKPAGRMGKLRIHKSGKVTMRLGTVVFDVTEAAECNFLQQVVARQEHSDDLFHLGDLSGRLMLTPDLEGLLRSVET